MTKMKNPLLIRTKINDFKVVLSLPKSDEQAEQICLKCRSVYGTLIQSIAWASSESEAEALYDTIPKVITLIEHGQKILTGHGHEFASRYLESIVEKKARLTRLHASRSLEGFLKETA